MIMETGTALRRDHHASDSDGKTPHKSGSGKRERQRAATRARILEAAVTCLIESGVARTTTLEVQRRAEVSRGALLHHFPTHAQLLGAVVDEIVRRNEQTVGEIFRHTRNPSDPLGSAIRTLAKSSAQPTFLAELELWLVARTDDDMRDHLIAAERKARRDRDRVINALFEGIRHSPAYDVIVRASVEFARGLAVSGLLRRDSQAAARRVEQWIWSMKQLVEQTPPEFR